MSALRRGDHPREIRESLSLPLHALPAPPKSTSLGFSASVRKMAAVSNAVPLPADSTQAAHIPTAVSASAGDNDAALVHIRADVAVFALRPRKLTASVNPDGEPAYEFGVLLTREPGEDSTGWALPSAWMLAHEAAPVAAHRSIDDALGLLNVHVDQLAAFEVDAVSGVRAFAFGYSAALALSDADAALTRHSCGFGVIEPDSTEVEVDGQPVTLPSGQAESLQIAVDTLRTRFADAPDPVGLLPNLFTLADLKQAHDAVMGSDAFSRDAFRRIMEPQMVIVGERKSGGVGRPAKVYRRQDEDLLVRPGVSSPNHAGSSVEPAVTHAVTDAGVPMPAAKRDQEQLAPETKLAGRADTPSSAQVDVHMRTAGDRAWLDELLAFASASLTISEDPGMPGYVRFGVSPACTNERVTEQILILIDKCQALALHSVVDLQARRTPHRQRRTHIRAGRHYADYSREMHELLNQLNDLGSVAQVLLDIACTTPDPVLRFNSNQVLRDVEALTGLLQRTAKIGLVAYDVVSADGSIPDSALSEIRTSVPVLLHMAGAEAVAFRDISDGLGALAEKYNTDVTRLTQRIWFVGPATH